MATLAQLSPAQVFAIAASAGDSTGRIGRWSVNELTAYNANVPAAMDKCLIAFNEAKALILGAGLVYTALTDLQFVNFTSAMAFSIAYGMLLVDGTGASGLPAENFMTAQQEFGQRIRAYWNLAGKYYDDAGISRSVNPYYDNVKFGGGFDIVTPDMRTPGYPYSSPFQIVP